MRTILIATACVLALAACDRREASQSSTLHSPQLVKLELSMDHIDEMLAYGHDEVVERELCELRTYHNIVYHQVRAEADLPPADYKPERIFDDICSHYPDISVEELKRRHEAVHPPQPSS